MLRRQRAAHIVSLRLHELLHLLALGRGLAHDLPRSRGIAALAGGAGRFEGGLELLAKRLELRLVLRVNGLEVRLLGVAQSDAFEKRAGAAGTTAAMRPMGVLRLLLRWRRGRGRRLLGGRQRGATE